MIIFIIASLYSVTALSAQGPSQFSMSGGLYYPNGTPITNGNVSFRVEVLDPTGTCVMYREEHLGQNLTNTKGGFALTVGTGTSRVNNVDGLNDLASNVFDNNGVTNVVGCAPLTLTSGDSRVVRVHYDLNTGGGYIAMTPDVPMTAAAYSMVAESLAGKKVADLVQIRNDNSSYFLGQTEIESVFNATNWPRLQALLNGTSSQYMVSNPSGAVSFNNQRITSVANPSANTDVANKQYTDSNIGGYASVLSGIGTGLGAGSTLIWDAVDNRWEIGSPNATDNTKLPLTGGTMSGGITMSGYDIYNAGHITMGNQRLLQLGTFNNAQETALTLSVVDAGKIFYNTDSSSLRVWNGSSYAGITPAGIAGGDLAGSFPNPSIAGSAVTTAKIADSAVTTAKIADGAITSSKISAGYAPNRLLITNAGAGDSVGYATCLPGEVLQYGGTGWTCQPVLSILGTSGVAAASYGNALSVGSFTVDAQGRITAAANQAIAFPVTSVAGKTGDVSLNLMDIYGWGTAALRDVGVAANNVVALDSSGRVPAVDGGLLTNVNATRLQSRVVASTAPSDSEVLMWNSGTVQWEPAAIPSAPVQSVNGKTGVVTLLLSDIAGAGDVTSVVAGTAATGGGTSGAITIGVDVGVGANQVVQLDSSSRLPAVDGGLVTNSNAQRLQGRALSAVVPNDLEVLNWNAGSAQWEPIAIPAAPVSSVNGKTGVVTLLLSDIVGAGDITDVNTGNGLLGGAVSGSVNLSVNAGVGANQIVQLDSSARLPAVDGYQLTNINGGALSNVNAVRLQSRLVAATAPNDAEVLGWNSALAEWTPVAIPAAPVQSVAGKTGVVTLNSSDIVGAITSVVAGTAATGGGTSGAVTLGVNVGTGANQVVQLDSSSRLPAVDGGLVTNSNAQRLQGRALSAVAPNNLEVLNWNSGSAQWEPVAIPAAPVQSVNGKTGVVTIELADIAGAGDITQVVAGLGSTGGGTSGVVTVGVDAGTGANQIVQLDSSSRLPAVDGGLVTNSNAQRLQGRTLSSVAPNNLEVLNWNSGSAQWEPIAIPAAPVQSVNGKTGVVTIELADIAGAGDITGVTAGLGVLGGGTSGNVTVSVNVGTGANQIVMLDSSARIPAIDAGLLSNVNAVRLQARAVSATAPNDAEVLGWNSALAQWTPVAIPSAPVQSVAGKTGVVTLNSSDIVGAITSVVAGTAATGGGTSGAVTLGVNVGTGANQVVQLDSSSRLPAVDGGLVTNSNAQRLQGRTLSAVAPNNLEVLNWNSGSAQWEPIAIPAAPVQSVNGKTGVVTIELADIAGAGDITQVVAGLGATGGGTAGVVTVGVDAGTGANQIVQLDSSSRLPAVDGGLVTNSNAQRLQGRALSAVAPNNLEVLNWNSGSAQWEPVAIPSAPVQSVNGKTGVVTIDLADIAGAGDITDVTAGIGVLGGGTSGNVTVSVNVGTGANQIVMLDSSARIPAVDAGLLSNVNAVRLQARAVSNAAPNDAEVLGWNSALAQWTPVAIPSAPVQSVAGKTGVVTLNTGDINGIITSVVAGTAATGGGSSGAVTLGVNVGTGANQVVQLDSSSRLPAVDGGLVTNSNAQRLQGRALSAVAPNNLEVLNWNSGSAQWEPVAIPSAPVQSVNGKTGVVTINLADIAGAGDITDVTAGNALIGGGSAGNVTLAVNVGTGANQVMQLDSSSRAPGVDGGLMTNMNAARLQARAVSAAAPSASQVLMWNAGTSVWEPQSLPAGNIGDITDVVAGLGATGGGTTGAITIGVNVGTGANQIVQLDALSRIPALDGGLLSNLNAIRLQGRAVASTAPASDQVLRWNGSLTQWEPSTVSFTDTGMTSISGDVVAVGSGAVVATISTDAITNTKIANDQVTSNKLKSTGIAINRLLITDASTGATIDYASCAQGEILKFNAALGWGCATDIGGTGFVTYVGAGSGLLGGNITSTGTLSVNTGTGANQIVQLDSSSRLPAVDGGLVTNSNAQRLQGRALSAVAPSNLEVLNWNSSSAQWEPIAIPSAPVQSVNGKTGVVTINLADIAGAGDITDVTAGIGILGGGTSGNVTVSVNVGTGANQIVMLDSSARIPALDGGLVTNSNAQRMQGRAIAATAPNNAEVLGWNASLATWLPVAIPSAPVASVAGKTGVVTLFSSDIQGAITSVVAGTAATGGGTSGAVTLGVNVGTGANQVVQLDSSSRLPAVDGGLVTNSNAQRLQGRALSAVAPSNLQVLNWNSGSAQWEPIAIPSAPVQSVNGKTGVVTINLADIAGAGDITDVTAGIGILGGGTSGNVTVSVNVGTGANQIVMLDSSARIPALDGGLVTNSNAQRIQGRAVAATAPNNSEVLGWNTSLATWLPVAIPSAPVTSVAGKTGVVTLFEGDINSIITDVTAGIGMLGGGTSGNVTVSVNVGTGANQIVQLDSSSRLPAVDGFNLTNINANSLSNVNAVRLQARAVSATAPASAQVLTWNSGTSVWEPQTLPAGNTGDITDVVAGVGMLGGGTSGAVTVSVNVGTGANQIVQLDSSARIPALDGGLVTNSNAQRIQGRAVAATAPNNSEVLGWNTSLATWLPVAIPSAPVTSVAGRTGVVTLFEGDINSIITDVTAGIGMLGGGTSGNVTISVNVGTGANQIVQLDSSSRLPAVDGGLVTNSNAQRLQARSVSAAAPAGAQVLTWNSGTSVWEPQTLPAGNTGDITDVVAGIGMLGGGTSGAVTLSVNVGTGANQIVRLDSSARIPALDGGLVTNSNAQRIQGRAVAATAPNNSEVLGWNTSLATWLPVAIPSAPVTSVAGKSGVVTLFEGDINSIITDVTAGIGMLGGGTSGNVTVSVNVGTGANQIVQLDSSSRLPAVDGFNLTNINANSLSNVNAVRLQARAVSATAPASAQVLTWNSGTSVWEPQTLPAGNTGDITDVTAGIGILGGGTSGNVTISVNVGTGANQIVQLDSSSRIPAVDAGLLSNVNAVRLQSRAVSSTAPTDAQVLTWNAAASQWRAATPSSAPVDSVNGKTGVVTILLSDIAGAGDVTDVTAGIGMLGGGTSGNVTVSVNVGTGANQIVQLDSSSRLPAVDGGLVTNSNAQRLQARAVSATAPASAQVLTWNSGTSVWEPQTLPAGNTGDITDVVAGIGMLGGGTSGAVTLSVNVGTSANQIVRLDSSARIPALDGGLVTNSNAQRIQGRAVAATAPNNSEVLGWNTSLATWLPVAIPSAPVTSVAGKTGVVTLFEGDINSIITDVTAGIGMLGGGTSGNVTISVNVGTGANQIVQLDSSSRLPAVDGFNLTNINANSLSNVNAVRLQARAVSATAPSGAQVLMWNSGTSVWEPQTLPAGATGDITDVTAGYGLLGGGTSGNVTLSLAFPMVASGTGTAAAPMYSFSGDADNGMYKPYVNELGFSTAGTERLKINGSGNVGIGTSTPTARVDIQGGSLNVSNGLNATVTLGNRGQISFDNASDTLMLGSADNSGKVGFGNATTPGSPALFVDSISNGGRIGIATITPTAGSILDIRGTGTAFSSILIPRDTAGLRPLVPINGMIRYNTTSQRFEAYEAGAWTNMITSIAGAGDITDVTAGFGLLGGGSSGNVTLSLAFPLVASGTGTAAAPMYSFSGDADNGMYKPYVNELAFSTAGTERLRIDGSGNAMIGAALPSVIMGGVSARLTVGAGSGQEYFAVIGSNSGTNVAAASSNSAGFELQNTNGTNGNFTHMAFRDASGGLTAKIAGVNVNQASDSGELSFLTSSGSGVVEVMRLTDDRKVGIGVSAPANGTILDITGTGAAFSSMIVPRETTALRPTVGLNGMIRFNTTTNKFEAYEGTWQNLISAGGGATNIDSLTDARVVSTSLYLGGTGNGSSAVGNTGVGINSLSSLAAGTNNTALGTLAGNAVNSGGSNTFIGYAAGQYTAGANWNTVVGSAAYYDGQGSSNVVVGENVAAGGFAPSGWENVLIGTDAASALTSGGFNIMIGSNSGDLITTGSSNILIGYYGSVPSATANGQMNIGNILWGTGIDGTGLVGSNARLGVGVTTPTTGTRLDIAGTGAAFSSILIPRDTAALRPTVGVNGMMRYNTTSQRFEAYEAGAWTNMITAAGSVTYPLLSTTIGSANAPAFSFSGDGDNGMYKPAVNELAFSTGGTERLKIDGSGNIGIGVTAPTFNIDISDSLAAGDVGVQIRNTSASGYSSVAFLNDAVGHEAYLFFNATGQASHGGNESFNLYNFNNANLTFGTNSVERIRITGAGRVGIGGTATTTGSLMDINGTGLAFSSMIIPRDTTALRPTVGINGMIRYNTTTNKFEAYEGTWQNLISSGGSVTYPLLSTTIGSANAPAFSFSGDGDNGMYKPAVNQLGFSTGGTERIRVDGSGNVGFGTYPQTNFHVQTTTGDADFLLQSANTSGGNASISLWSMASGGVQAYSNLSADHSGNMLYQSATGVHGFGQNGGSTTMILNGQGQLLIGSGGPTGGTLLDVSGTGAAFSSIIIPRDTTSNRPTTGVNGMMRFNTTSNKFEAYQGTWKDVIPAATTTTAALGADVVIAGFNTYFDGPSVTVAAGTWMFNSTITLDTVSQAIGAYFTCKLWNGTTVLASSQVLAVETTAAAVKSVSISLSGVATFTSTSTYKVSCASTGNNHRMKAATTQNGAGNNASTLTAVRLD